jgi:diguanylate cyclase (GGDEF)-like protein
LAKPLTNLNTQASIDAGPIRGQLIAIMAASAAYTMSLLAIFNPILFDFTADQTQLIRMHFSSICLIVVCTLIAYYRIRLQPVSHLQKLINSNEVVRNLDLQKAQAVVYRFPRKMMIFSTELMAVLILSSATVVIYGEETHLLRPMPIAIGIIFPMLFLNMLYARRNLRKVFDFGPLLVHDDIDRRTGITGIFIIASTMIAISPILIFGSLAINGFAWATSADTVTFANVGLFMLAITVLGGAMMAAHLIGRDLAGDISFITDRIELVATQKTELEQLRPLIPLHENEISDLVESFNYLQRKYGEVIDQLEESRDRLAREATVDDLTDLYNYRYFSRSYKVELSRARRHRRPLTLILADLDHFKRVNDLHGHDYGNLVLQKFSEILRTYCRDIDIPCRYGGEEFALLLPDTDQQAAIRVAERLRIKTEKEMCESKRLPEGGTTVSLGLATFAGELFDRRDLFALADAALYEAKRGGRNRVIVSQSFTEQNKLADLTGPSAKPHLQKLQRYLPK